MFKAIGKVLIEKLDKKGNIIEQRKIKNYVFKQSRIDLVANQSGKCNYIGIGTDGTAGTEDDAPALKAELRAEPYTDKIFVDDYTVQVSHTFTYFDSSYNIAECGLKLDNTKYFSRAIIDPAIPVDPDNNIKITYTVEITTQV